MQVQVRSTSTELSNASSATVVRDILVQVLHGTACETPAGLNPFVSYVADTAPSAIVQSGVVVTEQSAGDANLSIYVPSLAVLAQQQASTESEESMEQWMQRISQELGGVLSTELESILRGGQ